ncbi:MAG: DUF4350 domain-containing protein, partial [Polyangiaceae bacterium]
VKCASTLFAILAFTAVLSLALPVKAGLDPARAAADSSEILAQHRAFCTHPIEPMSPQAVDLCPYAGAIPDCTPLVDACNRALHKTPPPPPGWLRAIGIWLTRVFGGLFSTVGKIGVWILLGVTLLFILFPLIKALADSRNRAAALAGGAGLGPLTMKTEADAELVSAEEDPERLLEEGRQLADRGELDRALYRYLHAALLALDKRGAVRIAKGTTHGEYVRACNEVEAKAPLRDLVREIDLVRFGGREPSIGSVSVAAERAAWIVRRVALGLTMLALLLLPGCTSPQQLVGGHDPAGNELLRALLVKQGLTVKRVPASLAHLRLPTPETLAKTPALYVDVDDVPLAAESEAHLVSWVEAGGVLVLAGSPEKWPKELAADAEPTTSLDVEVKTYPGKPTNDEEDDDGEGDPVARVDHGRLAHTAALRWRTSGTFVLATTGDDKDYAAGQVRGKGSVYGLASDDLLTNAGLAVPGNAAAAIAILSNVPRTGFMFASPEDGYSPPTNPFASLLNAGLGLPLLHALGAILILFLAVGIRFARPRSEPPPQRRAFTEHVAATAAVYERTKSAKHALASFSRFAELRLVKRLGKGAPDIVSLLAQRSGERVEVCAHVWARGLAARELEHDKPNGDEIDVLRRLTAMYSKTVRSI